MSLTLYLLTTCSRSLRTQRYKLVFALTTIDLAESCRSQVTVNLARFVRLRAFLDFLFNFLTTTRKIKKATLLY